MRAENVALWSCKHLFACLRNLRGIFGDRLGNMLGIVVNVEFVLQTIGTEFPIEEPSLHGEQVMFTTVNRDEAVKSFYDMMKSKDNNNRESNGGEGELLAESRTKKKLREAVETDYGVIESWQHGQVVEGRGVGKDYV